MALESLGLESKNAMSFVHFISAINNIIMNVIETIWINLCMKDLINADRFAYICLATMNTVWCDGFGFILVRRRVIISFCIWPKMFMLMVLFSLVLFHVQLTISQTRTDYASVMDAIFNTRGYNKKVLPRLNITTPVLLDMDLDFLGIDAINEISEIMTSSGFLGVSWKDTGLSWIPKYYGNLDRIFVSQNDIWKPDIFLVNGYRKIVELGASFYYIEVDYTGTTTWLPFEVFESRCTLDTKRFPFDKQNCNITFSLLSLSEREVRIRECRRGLVLDAEFQENSVWRITSTDCIVHDEADDSYNNIVFIFNVERRPLYYIMNIILPIVFLGFLNGLVFVIPADSGEKMGYSVTVFLSLVVFFTIIGNLLPVSSVSVSVLGIYLFLQIALGVIIIVITSVQLRLQYTGPEVPVSGIYRKLANIRLSWSHKLIKNGKGKVGKIEIEEETEQNEKPEYTTTWSDVVRSIDFVGFRCFIVFYVIITFVIFLIITV